MEQEQNDGAASAEINLPSGNCAKIDVYLRDEELTVIMEVRFLRRASVDDRLRAIEGAATVAYGFYAAADQVKAGGLSDDGSFSVPIRP